jgi:GDP-4-dehydro-6-deoxy-D-mannose reductase
MNKVLITGASGFAGFHLIEYLLSQKEFELTGTYHSEESFKASSLKEKIQWIKADLTDSENTLNLITKTSPDYIFHLAAASAPSESFKNPVLTFQANVISQINILEAVRLCHSREGGNLNPRLLIVSSSEVYGRPEFSQMPINEHTPLNPSSPYAVSKIAQDYLGLQYFNSYKLECIRVRPFNHAGPYQKANFVVSAFAKQIAEIEKGKKEPKMMVGNLNAKRDFTDVRDMVRAYWLLIEKGTPAEVYNIGSGKSNSIKEILDTLLSFSSRKISVITDPQKFRPADIPDMICDNKKLVELTGWQPQISLTKMLQDTLDYWRGIV